VSIKELIVVELALYSWREGKRLVPGISRPAWRGIAHVLANRLRAGFWESDWLKILAEAPKHAPNLPEQMDFRTLPEHWDRDFRAHLDDCEKIYELRLEDDITVSANPTPNYVTGTGNPRSGLYYANLLKITSPWFQDKIVNHLEDHPRTAEISGGEGNLVFFG